MNDQKNYKKKIQKGLRWLPFDILHATTNQKHVGMMEGGWDRPRDNARTLGERDGNSKPLDEGDNDDDEYGKDGNIPDDNDKYAIGIEGVNKPIDKGDDECDTLSTVPA